MRILLICFVSILLSIFCGCTKVYTPTTGEQTTSITIDGSALKGTYIPLVNDPEFVVRIHSRPECSNGFSQLSSKSMLAFRRMEEENHTEMLTIPSDKEIIIQTAIGNDSYLAFVMMANPICYKYVAFVPQKHQNYLLKLNYSMAAFTNCTDHNIQLFTIHGEDKVEEKSAIYPEGEMIFPHGHEFVCEGE